MILINFLEFTGGFLVGYFHATLLESVFHEKVNDAPRRRVKKWTKLPWLLTPLIRTHFSHHDIHHCKTYRKDHITQFQNAEEKAALDATLIQSSHGREVIKALYGNKFSWWGWVAFCAPLIPGIAISYLILGNYVTLGVLLAAALPPFMSHYMHKYLHMPYDLACSTAPWPLSWLVRTKYIRAVTRHHFLHHRSCNKNFNLVLGGDWIRRRARKASISENEEMLRIGIRLD